METDSNMESAQHERLMRTITFTLLVAVMLSVLGCARTSSDSWAAVDDQVAAIARDVAKKARGDVNYFRGLTPARDRVPELMEQVARSGIATNYAEHLVVESDAQAALVYEAEMGVTQSTAFSIELSFTDGQVRVDQIVVGESTPSVAEKPSVFSEPAITPEEGAPALVSVGVSSSSLVAGTEQVAIVCYTNTSGRSVWVDLPLDAGAATVPVKGGYVSEWDADARDGVSAVMLAPFGSTCGLVRFTLAEPGDYFLFARANGVWSERRRVVARE